MADDVQKVASMPTLDETPGLSDHDPLTGIEKSLIGKGLVPHLRFSKGQSDTYWEYPQRPAPAAATYWGTLLVIVSLMFFFLVLLRGWPWAPTG